jgi:hypothetical protein
MEGDYKNSSGAFCRIVRLAGSGQFLPRAARPDFQAWESGRVQMELTEVGSQSGLPVDHPLPLRVPACRPTEVVASDLVGRQRF